MFLAKNYIPDGKKKQVSNMRLHWDDNNEERETEFRFNILSQSRSFFNREIIKSVMIKSKASNQKIHLLNSKEEFNRMSYF